MRLLNTETLQFSKLYGPGEAPNYAILSHRWGPDEVLYANLRQDPRQDNAVRQQHVDGDGFTKIRGACAQAVRDGYDWIWIDSCCIDKSSSAELQEAINSMWRYYAASSVCYVYLAGVSELGTSDGGQFAKSDWFGRAWTLQELLAPLHVDFYTSGWELIGTKFELCEQLAKITSINSSVLLRERDIAFVRAAEKFSWAAHRAATVGEDVAYSLMGLFEINMPLLYGEGQARAFLRLQEAIYKRTTDQSMFMFRYSPYYNRQPLMADSPSWFCDRQDCAAGHLDETQCLPATFTYADVVQATVLLAQAPEEITTTVTSWCNEMSTFLPVLEYASVSDELVAPPEDRSPITNPQPTHVAVLNQTTTNHPNGALCLLLRRSDGQDISHRPTSHPAILPRIGPFKPRLERARLFVVTMVPRLEGAQHIDTVVTLELAGLRVEFHGEVGYELPLSSRARQRSSITFLLRRPAPAEGVPLPRTSYFLVSCRGEARRITLQLAWLHGTWSFEKVCEFGQGRRKRKLETLFEASTLVDRCSVRMTDGRTLRFRLRRTSGVSAARIYYVVTAELDE